MNFAALTSRTLNEGKGKGPYVLLEVYRGLADGKDGGKWDKSARI
jgi:hypothetical protein